VALRHPEARRINDELAETGVVGDYRNPDLWRLGLSPLTTSYQEVWRSVEAARQWLDNQQGTGMGS
jgi:kynureninase